MPLRHRGHKGTAEEGIRLILSRVQFTIHPPAEEGIRLRAIFSSSAGFKTNLTMLQLPYRVKSA